MYGRQCWRTVDGVGVRVQVGGVGVQCVGGVGIGDDRVGFDDGIGVGCGLGVGVHSKCCWY